MGAVPVHLDLVGVDLYLATVPRIGEVVQHKGRQYEVVRVIHVVSEHPAHVRVVLDPKEVQG